MNKLARYVFLILLPMLIISSIFLVFDCFIISFILFCITIDGVMGLFRSIYKSESFDKIIFVENKYIPFKGYLAMVVFGRIFYKSGTILLPKDVNHEKIHIYQGKECGWFLFYFLYIIDFVLNFIVEFIKCFKNDNKISLKNKIKNSFNSAYNINCFELEAKTNEMNGNYLKTRNNYEWINNFMVWEN